MANKELKSITFEGLNDTYTLLTEEEVNTKLNEYAKTSEITQIDIQTVNTLPEVGVKGVIYLVPSTLRMTPLLSNRLATVQANTNNSATFSVDKTTNIKAGMTLKLVNNGTMGDAVVKSIDAKTKTITLTKPATLAKGTLIFDGSKYGKDTHEEYIWNPSTNKFERLGIVDVNAVSTATPQSVVARDWNGRAQIENPSVAKDIANKGYVDNIAKSVMDDLDLVTVNIDDSTNAYYPNKEDKEVFNTARNTISGSESSVGSMGFAINENNFHYGCLGLFVFKPYVAGTTLLNVRTITCERFGQSQDFTVAGKISDHEGSEIHLTLLTEEVPYLYSEDTYSFSKIIFKNAKGEIIETLEPSAGQPADLIQWYGCVTQWTKTPSTTVADYVELQGNYYMPKADNIGAFYYVDIPSDIIAQNLVDEPTCIKIDANYDSGTRQSYIDWPGHNDECLKANYIIGNNFLTLSLKKNKREGQGLEQKPVFSANSCIRFTDHPEIGNIVVGSGYNNVAGKGSKALYDYGFSSGKNNASVGRYSVTGGTRNTAVYGAVALGNHNAVLGQSGFAVGETNFVSRSGMYGAALGSNNTVNGKNSIAAGRSNEIEDLYGVAFGHGNKVKGKSSSALGYTNTLNDDSEFAAGTGNTLSGENAVAIGRANQSYGKSNTCIGYGNIVNKCICGTAIGNVNHVYANYAFAAGNNNTVNADASGTIGLNLNIKTSSESGVYNNVGHLLIGSNNTINGGRNLIMGGQSSVALLHDSIIIGNNLKETSKGFGKAIFGSYNAESGASIVLGAGSSNSNRKNVFEVFSDGAVKTPNARAYKTDGTDAKRLTTKEYVDNASNGKLDKVSSFEFGVYVHVGENQHTMPYTANIGNEDGESCVVLLGRDSNGRAQVNEPVEDKDIANKKYVDDTISATDISEIAKDYTVLNSKNWSTTYANVGNIGEFGVPDYTSSKYPIIYNQPVNEEAIELAEIINADTKTTIATFTSKEELGTSNAATAYHFGDNYTLLVIHPQDGDYKTMMNGAIPYSSWAYNYCIGVYLTGAITNTSGELWMANDIPTTANLTISFTTPLVAPKGYKTLLDSSYLTRYKYTIYDDGRKECKILACAEDISINSSWGTLYEGSLGSYSFKSGFFTAAPEMSAEIINTKQIEESGSEGGVACLMETGFHPTATSTGALYAVRPNNAIVSSSTIERRIYFKIHAKQV